MRGIIYPVVALIAAIIVGASLLILRPQSLWVPAIAALTGEAHGKTGSLPSPFGKAKTAEKSRTTRPQSRSIEPEGSVTVNVIPLPLTVTVTDTPRRFPLAQEIVKGMTKSAVLASFANPTATVTGADVGHLVERLIYLDSSSMKTTLIYFVDGKVIRAETETR